MVLVLGGCSLFATLFGCGSSLEAFGSSGAAVSPTASASSSTGSPSSDSSNGAPPPISEFLCASGSVLGSVNDTCTVYLSSASASGPVLIALSSNNSSVAVPATVTVPENATSVQFTADIASVGTTQTAVITASDGADSQSYQVKLLQAVSTLVLDTPKVVFQGYVPLNTAVTQPIYLVSSGSVPLVISAATITGSGFQLPGATFPMTLNPGQEATLQVQFSPTVQGPATGQISFVSNSSTGTQVTTLSGLGGVPPVSQLVCKSASALGAATNTCTVYLSAASASGPVSVNLSSNDPSATVPATVAVPAGATSAQFTVNLASVTNSQTAVITASTGASSQSYQVKLLQAISTLVLDTQKVAFSGYVPLNTTVSQPVSLVSSGSMPVTITAANVTGPGFQLSGATFPLTLNPGQGTTLQAQFTPTVQGTATGQISFVSNSSTGTQVTSLSGLGGVPPVSQLVCKGASAQGAATDTCTVYLSAAAASGPVSVALSSTDASATVPATVTVPAGATSAQFTVNLASVATSQTAVITASTGASSQSYQVKLLQAVSTLVTNASTLAFSGYVPLNTTVSLPINLLSSGTMPVTITAATVTGSGFKVSGATFPLTLNAGQSETLQVQFTPTVSGASTGKISFVSNSSTGPLVVNLSGLSGASPLSQFFCSKSTALGAATDTCTVYLSTAAANGPVSISLSSNNSAVAVPATVTVPANANSVQFTVNMASVPTTQTALITASTGASSKTVELTLDGAFSTMLLLTPKVAFSGYIPVNTTSTQPIYMWSTGSMPLIINAATVTGAGFEVVGTTFPMTLNPGQKATLEVQFAPTVPGSVSGQLTLESNSTTGSTTVIPLSATASPTGKFPGSPVVSTLVPPNPSAPIPSQLFGMTIYNVAPYSTGNPSVLTPFPTFPIGTLRLWDVDYWANLQPRQTIYHWSKMDADVAAGIQNGVQDFIFTFGQPPTWASTNPTLDCGPQGEGPGTCSPPIMADYDAFATQVVQRYCGKIKYYEPWNEPNNPGFWVGTNAQMLTIAQHLYTIAKDPANCGCTNGSCAPNGGVNPNKVLLPPIAGVVPAAVAWLDSYLADANMTNPYADIAAFHGYVWHGYQPEQIVPEVQSLQQTLSKYGLGNLELWDTETSWEYNTYFNEQQQASWLMRSYTAEAALGVTHFIWYAYDSCTWGTLWNTPLCDNHQIPVSQLTPAGTAYGVMESWLSGASLTQCQEYQSGLWACELQRTGGYDAWMIWSTTGGNITQAIPSSLGLTKYHDASNNINALPSELTVTPMPMLLEQ
jgi:hypothetical protein